jgi:hypothetical protein
LIGILRSSSRTNIKKSRGRSIKALRKPSEKTPKDLKDGPNSSSFLEHEPCSCEVVPRKAEKKKKTLFYSYTDERPPPPPKKKNAADGEEKTEKEVERKRRKQVQWRKEEWRSRALLGGLVDPRGRGLGGVSDG